MSRTSMSPVRPPPPAVGVVLLGRIDGVRLHRDVRHEEELALGLHVLVPRVQDMAADLDIIEEERGLGFARVVVIDHRAGPGMIFLVQRLRHAQPLVRLDLVLERARAAVGAYLAVVLGKGRGEGGVRATPRSVELLQNVDFQRPLRPAALRPRRAAPRKPDGRPREAAHRDIGPHSPDAFDAADLVPGLPLDDRSVMPEQARCRARRACPSGRPAYAGEWPSRPRHG